jgi:hypothetical protein
MSFPELVTAIATNGIGLICAAAVLWFAYYRETRTIPDMMRTFTASMERANTSFEHRNQGVLETFALAIKDERQTCERWHIENLKQHDQQRDRMDQMLLEQKENRHLIRELSHQLGLRQALEATRNREKAAIQQEPPVDQ